MSSVKLRLMCLVWPDDKPNEHIVEVEVDNDRTVAALKKIIKLEYSDILTHVDAYDLVLWKCAGLPDDDDDLEQTLKTIRFDGSDVRLVRLNKARRPISQFFKHEDIPKEPIHILVEAPALDKHLAHTEAGDVITELAENMRFIKIVQNSGKPPSMAAKSNEYVKIQAKEEYAIHDGLHSNATIKSKLMTTVAPPVHIFHPIFEQFIRDANDPQLDLPREFLIRVQGFMSFASQLKTSEQASNPGWRGLLTELVAVGIHEVDNADGTRPDGISTFDITSLGESVPFLIWEYKRILGEGGCDPSIQAGCSMRRAWIQPDRSTIRDRCCCPTFMIAGGGPWMCILGAVFTDKVIVQRLTDLMWIGLSSTNEDAHIHRFARVMMALRQNLPKLQDYYEKISTADDIPPFNEGSPHPRFYPYPKSFIENGKPIGFDYVKMLEDDPTCVTYLAKIRRDVESSDIDEPVVVKFVDRYGDRVHQFLADKNHSPKLRYYGPLEVDDSLGNNSPAPPTTASPSYLLSSPMKMVVMDYVKPHRRPDDAHAQLEKILIDLHTEGYVFGDLREPNILFDKDGKVQLIDFNWAGRYDMELKDTSLPPDLEEKIRNNFKRVQGSALTESEFVKYPLSLSSKVSWARGVDALLPIRPQHDWDMLRTLSWN